MCRENGVAVADYTVHIIFCLLEHVIEVVSFCLFVFYHTAIIYPDYGIVKANMTIYLSNKVSVKSHAYVV